MNKYSPYILYLLISILIVILYVNNFGPMRDLQRSVDDMLCRITATEDTRPNVALVTIDARALNEYGEWPWHNDLIADLTAATASGQPRAIVLDIELYEDAAQDSAGYTDILAEQLDWIDRAVLPYDIALATFRSDRTDNPEYLFNNSIIADNPLGVLDEQSSLLTRKVFLPAEKLLASHPYLGFDYHRPDEDRVLRHQPLTMFYEGYYYPSISLLAAAVYLNTPTNQVKIIEGKEIQIGTEQVVPINERGDFYVNFSKGTPFAQYSAADILAPDFDLSVLKDKAVLIGLTDGVQETYTTPVQKGATELLTKATIVENIINDNMLVVRNDLASLSLLVLVVLGAICAFILPRVNMMHRMIILGGALIILGNVNYLLFSSYRMIIQTVYIALELILFMAASPLLDWQVFTGQAKKTKAHPVLAKPKKASPQPIEVPTREIRESAADPMNIATKALTSADQAVANQAIQAAMDSSAIDHQTISLEDYPTAEKTTPAQDGHSTGGKPVPAPEEPIERADYITDSDQIPVDQSEIDSSGTSISESGRITIDTDGSQLSALGRYQVTGVLGKGAMGTVYKGIDPAINRPVALKTIRLDFVNDPDEMAELKERLHREAQAAGKMSHPNIVTIYEFGSEGSLQYIAMEFLEGQTLENLIKKKVRFNYRIIAQIISQICSALEYAHERGIVHRDIKPANIMVLSDYRVKVMDYGIARVDSNSMTKTGIAMGTPNYISPEQLKGLPTDRRADLFSLGVVMYEMLLGRRPFKGENITALMYSIMNHEPEKPSSVNPQIPLLFDHIIGRALKKDPAQRYQRASEITADIQDFVESFAR